MNIGDVVKWHWHLGIASWEKTEMKGLIVDTRVVKTKHEEVGLLDVLLTDGTICEVREDKDDLERVV
jgi:hypothetical protein